MAEVTRGTILYGMMGSGKTTLGRGLAQHFGQLLTDTDELVETMFGLTCKQIVDNPGMDFPNCQVLAVLGFRTLQPEVIATGGSVAVYPKLVDHLAHFGTSIFIEADPVAVEARLPEERIAALNSTPGSSFQKVYADRLDLYRAAADHTLIVSGDEVVDTTLARLIDLRESVA